MKNFLILLVTASLLAGCSPSRRVLQDAATPVTGYAHQPQHTPDTGTPPAGPAAAGAPPALTPPTLAPNATRRDYKAYKHQLDAWQAAQQAYAKAQAGPVKVKTKGTGAQTTTAAAGAVVRTEQTTTDNTKAGQRGGAVADHGATVTRTDVVPDKPWYASVLGNVKGIVGGAAVLLALGAAVYFGWPYLLAWRKRRAERASTSNQA